MDKELHKLTIISRSEIEITGVIDISEYNDEEIEIETHSGMLTLCGTNFNIVKFDTETGYLNVNGNLDSAYYSEKANNRKKFFSRIFN